MVISVTVENTNQLAIRKPVNFYHILWCDKKYNTSNSGVLG